MNNLFAETLQKVREEKGISQRELGKQMFVNHSTIARWESGTRLPDITMIPRLASCLGVDANMLFQLAVQSEESPNVIMVDDSSLILTDGLNVLAEVMPNATITGFIWPLEAIEYAKMNRVALAILDIELGTASGLDLCRTLLEGAVSKRPEEVNLRQPLHFAINPYEGTKKGGEKGKQKQTGEHKPI